jgi:hypothetical protein
MGPPREQDQPQQQDMSRARRKVMNSASSSVENGMVATAARNAR